MNEQQPVASAGCGATTTPKAAADKRVPKVPGHVTEERPTPITNLTSDGPEAPADDPRRSRLPPATD